MNHPTKNLAHMLSDLLASSLPVNLVPGPSDPCGAVLPQQPMPKVMFGGKKMEGLECNTNPTWLEIGDRRYEWVVDKGTDEQLPLLGRTDYR